MVVLRRLKEAEAEGDPVHAVVLGTGLSNDGGHKASFVAPSAAGQAAAISAALNAAGTRPEEIGYIEAHGTGTELGDVIEVEGITLAYGVPDARRHRAALGSCKTNFGHLDAAAGTVGLIKAAVVLDSGVIPPLVNFQSPNPRIDWASAPVSVCAQGGAWPVPGPGPRRAGVSSFGIGGTNAHAIVEQAPEPAFRQSIRRCHLLPVSASDPDALQRNAKALADHFGEGANPDLASVARTLQVGRREMRSRAFVVCDTLPEAQRALAALPKARPRQAVAADEIRIGGLFPGGGSQSKGMGLGLAATEPVMRRALDGSAAVLKEEGIDLYRLLEDCDGTLHEPANLQVALFALEHALNRLLESWGIRPDFFIGHSIGEFVAAVEAGVFAHEDALRLVALRGKLMRGLPMGAMLSIAAPVDVVTANLQRGVEISSVNACEAVTVAGDPEAVDRMEAHFDSEGYHVRRIRVAVASHTSATEPMVRPFVEAVAKIERQSPQRDFVSNITGDWITAADAVDPAYWGNHLKRPVLFAQGLETLASRQPHVLLEIGPATGLARRGAGSGCRDAAAPLRHAGALGGKNTRQWPLLARFGPQDRRVNWDAVAEARTRSRTALPGYRFAPDAHWHDLPERTAGPVSTSTEPPSREEGWFWLPAWRRRSVPVTETLSGRRVGVLAEPKEALLSPLSQKLRSAGADLSVANDPRALAAAAPDMIIDLMSCRPEGAPEERDPGRGLAAAGACGGGWGKTSTVSSGPDRSRGRGKPRSD